MVGDTDPARAYWSSIESVPLEHRFQHDNFYALMAEVAERHSERPALSFQLKADPKAPSVTISYADYFAKVTQSANLFRSLGVGRDDAVALLLPNLPQTAYALLGAQAAGIAVPINPLLAPEQIASILRESGAKVLVSLAPFPKTDIADKAASALALAPDVACLLEVDLRQYLRPPLAWIIPLIRPKRETGHSARVLDFDQALSEQRGDALGFEDAPGRDSTSACFHTGGTTGQPKLARHNQSNTLYTAWVAHELLFRKEDVILCALPMFHVFAAYIMTMAPIAAGSHVVMLCPAGFRAEGILDSFWKLVHRWRATFFLAVPAALVALRQRPVNADVSTLQFAVCGSAPLPRELFREFEESTGLQILEGYGQTESTCVISCNPPAGPQRLGSVGLRLPYTEVRALAPAGEGEESPVFAALGESGELVVRGPNVFPGYVREELNRDIFVNGEWLRTGDLGHVDSDGYIWITGRRKDTIIRSGHNIDPGTIEEVLAAHPAVALAAAVGAPDAKAGELPVAFVELVPGRVAEPEELLAFAAERVQDPVSKPVSVEILETMPLTAISKVYKPDLRKMAIRRTLGDALAQSGVTDAQVEVVEDSASGFVARIATSNEEKAREVLAAYPVRIEVSAVARQPQDD